MEVAAGGVISISVDLGIESDEICFMDIYLLGGRRETWKWKENHVGFPVRTRPVRNKTCLRFFPCIALDTRGIFKCSVAMFAKLFGHECKHYSSN